MTTAQEESDRAFRERTLTHRIEHYLALFHNANLAGQADQAREHRQIIRGLANQYYSMFKARYVSVSAREVKA